jgi:formamidase
VAVREVRIDRSKTLLEEPATGHNRWHPDIAPIVVCEPGDEVVLDTRDAFDGQMGPQATLDTVAAPNLDLVHPLTGPVYVEGAQPGDLLEVEILEVVPDTYGYTVQVPGFGFLRDVFPEPFMVRWDLADGWATSADLPGVRIPGAPFMAPSGFPPAGRQCGASPRANRRRWIAVGLCLRPRRPAQYRRTRGSPRRRCGRFRRGSRRATSTSSNWPAARTCSSRSTPRVRCSPPGMRTSRRETARRVAPRSK